MDNTGPAAYLTHIRRESDKDPAGMVCLSRAGELVGFETENQGID